VHVATALMTALSTCASAMATRPLISMPTLADADPGCQVSEVARLLWTVVVMATAAGSVVAVRPSWLAVTGLLSANLVWLWVDMEGPVLVSRGTHGLHVADIPVAISAVAVAVAVVRLVVRRHAPRRLSSPRPPPGTVP
jgi:hypothetical protein